MVGTYWRGLPQSTRGASGLGIALLAATMIASLDAGAVAQDAKHYRFAYDQPKSTGYGIAGDAFADKLKELSRGTMLIDQ